MAGALAVPAPDAARAPLRIAVIGGGPGGLYAAALLKRLDPAREITLWERGAPDDTFGFGVVLSDETLGGIEHADPAVYQALRAEFVRWDDIDIVHRGHTLTSGGHGFAALGRRRLLEILHERCHELGVDLRFRAEAPPAAELAAAHDLVIAADGVHSPIRQAHAAHFAPRITRHRCRYIWLAADFAFDAFRFEIAETGHGVMQLHGYPYAADASTVIVEMREEVWEAAGFAALDEQASAESCAKIFSDALGGRPLRGNNSSWTAFRTVVNERWSYGNTVLLGDAAHTAHFSIGSGTKLAVEDALALAACIEEQPDLPAALGAYERERRPVVASTQRAAAASLRWFEDLARYLDQPARQFAFNLLTRSRPPGHPRQPPPARPPLHRRRGARIRLPTGHPAHVHPLPAARPRTEEPRRGLAHGHVLRRGRRPRRLPPRPPRRPRARRRGPGHDRDGVREPRRPHHTGLHRPLHPRTGPLLAADRGLRPPAGPRHRLRRPARPLRAQGLDQADVGRHGPAARHRQLAPRRRLPHPVPARYQPGPARP
ncbi:hypothetical protein GCM10022284_27820 [Streptomyces hundungensis]